MPSSQDDLKKAYKAFKKRLKLTKLDDDSRIGHGKSFAVTFDVKTDDFAFRYLNVVINDGPKNASMATDLRTGEENRIVHSTVTVDADIGTQYGIRNATA